jgi:predicted phage terminase large subunit-like protein
MRVYLLMKKNIKALHMILTREVAKRQKEKFHWDTQARPEQKMPEGDWKIWLILAGRGFGKTRTGAETVKKWIQNQRYRRICLLGHHWDDVRRVMIEGESGLLSVFSSEDRPIYEPSKRQLYWPKYNAFAFAYSGDAYSQLRGPQFDAAWIDEFAKFSYAQKAWDQLMLCLRLGKNPRVLITTTPRPMALLRTLIQRPDIVLTRGSTFDNQANLSPSYLQELSQNYKDSRLGAQEINGVLLDDCHDGLWKADMFIYRAQIPPLQRIIVAIDPAVTQKEHSDETGIIVAGKDKDGYGYVLQDLSGRYSPTQWITLAVNAYHQYKADCLLAEINNGGDLVQHLLHTLFPQVPYRGVQASRRKAARAEPIAALYQQKKIIHATHFSELEAQMLSEHSAHDDRKDALVWALTELFFSESKAPSIMCF